MNEHRKNKKASRGAHAKSSRKWHREGEGRQERRARAKLMGNSATFAELEESKKQSAARAKRHHERGEINEDAHTESPEKG